MDEGHKDRGINLCSGLALKEDVAKACSCVREHRSLFGCLSLDISTDPKKNMVNKSCISFLRNLFQVEFKVG